jgi:peptidoglycan/xylan/chitin deacetylase (PgdA/CDA1 family)
MRINIYKIILISSFLSLFSCINKGKKIKPKPYKAGVVISFDDAYVDEWFAADKVLKKYNWKATFCACRIDSIGKPQIDKLHELQIEGHEIAGHGYHHYNAVKFVARNGIRQYLKQEINPMLVSMKQKGFAVSSFAYPYGERSDELDKALLPKFKVIRGRDFCALTPEKEGSYFRGTKLMYAFDIDNNHIHFSIPYVLELLDYAKKNNKILILCSHKPVKNVTANYQTKLETLEFICKYMKLNNMKFYRLSDLDDLETSN